MMSIATPLIQRVECCGLTLALKLRATRLTAQGCWTTVASAMALLDPLGAARVSPPPSIDPHTVRARLPFLPREHARAVEHDHERIRQPSHRIGLMRKLAPTGPTLRVGARGKAAAARTGRQAGRELLHQLRRRGPLA